MKHKQQATRRRRAAAGACLAALAALGMSGIASAQQYPSRPVRLIVPFAPGGGTDILARVIGQKLAESLGQQFVVDNRAGAGGNIGAELTAKAARDGYTIMMVSASYSVNAAIYKLSFDPVKDLNAVAQVASVPFVLVGYPSLPANNVKELIALARAKPGELNYASSGNGSAPHLAGALLMLMTNTQMVHVPYKGGSPAINDVIAGQVQMLFSTVIQAMPFIKAGRLKPIALASTKRAPSLPQVATIHESGVTGFDVTNWFGILAPDGTPQPIVAKLNSEIVRHVQSPELMQRLAAEGADPVSGSPAEFEKLIRADIAKYSRVVKEANITVQ